MKRKRTRAHKRALMEYYFGGESVGYELLILREHHRWVKTRIAAAEKTIAEEEPPLHTRREPPALAEFLLASLTRREHSEAVVGDLSERFALESEALGYPRARRLYWARVLRSLWPLLQRAASRAIKLGALVSILKRF